jgi:putative endonuclease
MSRNHQYYVYIVECADHAYYTGLTNNLTEHNEGLDFNSFTFKRRPVNLKYLQCFSDNNQAISWKK